MTEPDDVLPDRDLTAPLDEPPPSRCPECGCTDIDAQQCVRCGWMPSDFPEDAYDDFDQESEPGDGMGDPPTVEELKMMFEATDRAAALRAAKAEGQP